MTLVSYIVQQAYRESNITPIAEALSADQRTEGLNLLQTFVSSIIGSELGVPLQSFPVGRNNIQTPIAYPESIAANDYIPLNRRLDLNLTEATTVNLHPSPQDGSRLAVIDNSDNLATYNLIIRGNGRSIEDATSVTLNTNGLSAEWFYRADLGDWRRVSALDWDEEIPFPNEFDDMFIIGLALRLNPRHGQNLAPETVEIFKRMRSLFRARYKQNVAMSSEIGLLRTSANKDYGYDHEGDSTDRFEVGR